MGLTLRLGSPLPPARFGFRVCGWGRATRVVNMTPSVTDDLLKRRPNERDQRGKFVHPVEIVGFGVSDCAFGLFRYFVCFV